VYRALMGKPKGERLLVSPRHRRENGIKTDLREIGWVCVCVCVEWSGFPWLRKGTVGGLW
jgi:hypothetical protein